MQSFYVFEAWETAFQLRIYQATAQMYMRSHDALEWRNKGYVYEISSKSCCNLFDEKKYAF